ncbi:MAG: hypothetical protein LZF60_420008 [Nitrospira sp.]|nr:MAG: hypothetical protein LZF60_420008 [Nitrospira sp.]
MLSPNQVFPKSGENHFPTTGLKFMLDKSWKMHYFDFEN